MEVGVLVGRKKNYMKSERQRKKKVYKDKEGGPWPTTPSVRAVPPFDTAESGAQEHLPNQHRM
jgi:hypothetical protein